MHKILTSFVIISSLTACAVHSVQQSDLAKYDQKLMIDRNTLNMSEFDKQKYYTDHNLGPVPAELNPKGKQRRE